MSERPPPEGWVEDLWAEMRPSAVAKMQTIGKTVESLAAGEMTPTKREAGCRAAQQLAGSLGSYGMHDGAEAAAELERLLGSDTELDVNELARLVLRLNTSVRR